jgi:hypothetical protein
MSGIGALYQKMAHKIHLPKLQSRKESLTIVRRMKHYYHPYKPKSAASKRAERVEN